MLIFKLTNDMSFLDKLSSFLPLPKKAIGDEYYFALNIEPAKVEAAIWGIEDKKLQIIASATANYIPSASGGINNSLTQAANIALDEALADFQPEPEKILFGVPESWLQDDNLKEEYLKNLKHMVTELGVVPMAYVSTLQAICHYLAKIHGVPLTAILVQISDPLVVSVIKAGKIIASKNQKRSDNLPQDIEHALLSFSDIEVMPSKILIYGPANNAWEKFKDELLSFSWMAQLPFLHLPKIDSLDSNIALMSICQAGALEVNPHGAFHATGVNIREKELKPTRHPNEIDFIEENTGASGVALMNRESPPQERYPVSNVKKFLAIPKIGKLSGLLSKLLPRHTLIVPVVVLLLLIVAAILLPKAKVKVFIDLRVLDKESTVTADPSINQVNEEDKKIPGKVVETTISGSSKGSASGKKQIGDPAKGVVVIYNKTSSPKTFSSGTVLGSGGLMFTLDSSVNIASSSAVEGGIAFGKTTGNVTAVSIGPDGNLPAGTELTIKDQPSSSFSAKTDNAFSGGVSKDVTVVTSDDQKRLLASLSSDLRKQAQIELQGKLTGPQKILEEALVENIVKQSYSKGVSDQASDFTLNLTIHYKGTAYSDDDLKLIVSKLVDLNVPNGYQLDLTKTETEAQVSKVEKDGRLIFVAKFRAKLIPKLDIEKIKKDLVGKSVIVAAEKLKSIDNVIGSDIVLQPKLPIKQLQRMPFLPQNISIEITAK